MLFDCQAAGAHAVHTNGHELYIVRWFEYRTTVEADGLHDAADRFARRAYGFHPHRIGDLPILAYCLTCRCPLPTLSGHGCEGRPAPGRYRRLTATAGG